MNLIKSFRVAALALALVVPALAEQRVVIYAYDHMDIWTRTKNGNMGRSQASGPIEPPSAVTNLLTKGYRITLTSVSGPGNGNHYLVIFVLESPTAPAQLDETTSTDDLFRIRKLTPEEIAREKAKIKEGAK